MRVLLTGAAGLIGRATTRLLCERGHEVLGTDLRPMPTGFETLPWRALDVRQTENVKATLAQFRPDAVVHLAAKHFIPWCNRFPAATLQTNVVGCQNILEGVRHADVAKLVFASSAAVYGPSTGRLTEDSSLAPDDIYGSSKLMCEQLLELAGRSRDTERSLVVLRLFNTVGPGDPNPHLIPRLVSELRRGRGRLRLGNLTTIRDYIYVDDVARALLAATEVEPAGLAIANVGSGAGRSVGEVVEALARLVGRPLEAVSTPVQRRTVDRPFLVADPSRARSLLGWEPAVSFEEGLARTLIAGGVRLDGHAPQTFSPAALVAA